MGGDTGAQTVQQKSDPWPGVQQPLLNLYGASENASQRTPSTPFGGRFVAEPSAQHRDAVAGLTNLAKDPKMANLGDPSMAYGKDLAEGKYLNANNHLAPAINAAVRPIFDRLTDTTLPQVRSEAQTSGAYGGSRQGVLESLAMKDAGKQAGDTAEKIFNENWMNERRLMTFAPQITGQGAALNQIPTNLMDAAGNMQIGKIDQPIWDDELAKFEDSVNAPWRPVLPWASVLSGVGNPGYSSVSRTSPGGSTAGGMMSGAAGGAALGMTASMAGGGGPWDWPTWAGTVLGAGTGGWR